MIRDNHPLLFALNNEGMSMVQDYFGGTETTYKTDQTYTSATGSLEDGTKAQITHTTNHNWAHDFQEISSALLAGLAIETIGEHNLDDWHSPPILKYSPDLKGWITHNQPQVPLTFSMAARKEA